MAEGLLIEITHSGLTSESILINDLDDSDQSNLFPSAGPTYVPFGGTVELVYTRAVAVSFETGAIRKLMENGQIAAQVIFGTSMSSAVAATVPAGLFTDSGTEIYPENLYDRGFVIGSPSMDDTGNVAHDKRMFFDPVNACFRGGRTINTSWDVGVRASAKYSFAWGNRAYAGSTDSVAFGDRAGAYGSNTFVVGSSTYAYGYGNIAMGVACYVSNAASSNSLIFGTLSGVSSGGDGCTVVGYNCQIGTGGQHTILGYKNGTGAGATTYGTVLGGNQNEVRAPFANVLGGSGNTAYGANSVVSGFQSKSTAAGVHGFAMGYKCETRADFGWATGWYTYCDGDRGFAANARTQVTGYGASAFGFQSLASGDYSFSLGENSESYFHGQLARATAADATNKGDPQESFVDAKTVTIDDTVTQLLIDGTDHIALPANTTWYFKGRLVARQVAGTAGVVGDSAFWDFDGLIKLVGGTTTLINSSGTTNIAPTWNDINAAGWTISLSADDTNDALKIDVDANEINKTIRWAVFLHLFEVGPSTT